MINQKHKISIEEFEGKNYQVTLIEPEDKAILTHYLHNIENGISKHYKKDALKVLKNLLEYKQNENIQIRINSNGNVNSKCWCCAKQQG